MKRKTSVPGAEAHRFAHSGSEVQPGVAALWRQQPRLPLQHAISELVEPAMAMGATKWNNRTASRHTPAAARHSETNGRANWPAKFKNTCLQETKNQKEFSRKTQEGRAFGGIG